jgi:glycosyltransferase involved in cell wall biosynthesis
MVSSASPNVRFAGFLPERQLDQFFATCKIFVCPSRWYEGFPNVVARAMAHGRPVVGARIGVMHEIIEHGVSGVLYESGDADQLTAAIERLWRDPHLCMSLGSKGRQEAERRFAPDVVNAILVQVYRDLVGKEKPQASLPRSQG